MIDPASRRDAPSDEDDENTLLMTNFGENNLNAADNLQKQPSKSHVSKLTISLTVLLLVLVVYLTVLPLHLWRYNGEDDSTLSDFVVEDTPRTRVFHWTVSEVINAPVGVEKPMVVVNGVSPGPTIEANLHDRIIVFVKNELEEAATSIHWHGLHQNGTNHYDGSPGITQCGIPPGGTLVYNFTLDGYYGTTWWHGHLDMQDTDGLFGAIVVHNSRETVPLYDEERVLMLSDVYNTPAAVLLEDYLNTNPTETIAEPVPDAVAVNGVGQFSDCQAFSLQTCNSGAFMNLDVSMNKTYRLRIINTGSFASIRFSVDSHTLTVIEADGTPVIPTEVDGVTLHVAQRYSVLLKTGNEPKVYWIRTRMNEQMFAYENPHMSPETLGVLRYEHSPELTPAIQPSFPILGLDLNADQLIPAEPVDAPLEVDLIIPWTFSIQRTSSLNWRSFINGTSWEPLPSGQSTLLSKIATEEGTRVWPEDQLIVCIDDIAVVDFVINNLDDGDHPFHLHGYKPWIMGSGRGRYLGTYLNTTNPMRRDTFLVPAFHWMVVRIVTDTPGYWAFHCHVAWHMAAGALFQVAVQTSFLDDTSIPVDLESHCRYWMQ